MRIKHNHISRHLANVVPKLFFPRSQIASVDATVIQRSTITRNLTLLLVVLFSIVTIRDGHYWGDDFAQYLQHAHNIIQLKSYSESGYIYNPLNPTVGPRAYPPGYPYILAPLVGLYGLNLAVCKMVNVLLWTLSLLIILRLISRDLSEKNVWAWLVIVGFCPVYWVFRDRLESEHLFIPLWYATLLVTDDWYRFQRVYGSQFLHGVILGSLIFMACSTRTVGLVLLPTIVLCEIIVAQRMTRVGVVASLTAILLLVLERLILPASGSGYIEHFRNFSLGRLASNAYCYTTAFSVIWENLHWDNARKIAGITFAIIASIGFLKANYPRGTPLGIAHVVYFVVIIVWPSVDGVRLILPLLPGFVFYLLIGCASFKVSPYAANAACMGLLLFTLLSYATYYSSADFRRISEGVETPPAQELFEFVRYHADPDEVCLFFKPRALALYTGHRSSAYPLGVDVNQFLNYATTVGAKMMIARLSTDDIGHHSSEKMLRQLAISNLDKVFVNSEFIVYRWGSVNRRPVFHE